MWPCRIAAAGHRMFCGEDVLYFMSIYVTNAAAIGVKIVSKNK